MLTARVNKRYIITDGDLVSKLLMEPARCFFIALGRATNQNPVLLQSALRAEAQVLVAQEPHLLRIGFLAKDPLQSLLRYGEYVDHNVLLTNFPESLMEYRIVVYTCSWGRSAQHNVIDSTSYQAKMGTPVKVATIYLQANQHYKNIVDNSELAHIPIVKAIPTETSHQELNLMEFHPVTAPPMPVIITPQMANRVREECERMRTLVPRALYSHTLAEAIATRVTGMWDLKRTTPQHLNEGKGPKHIDLGYNLIGSTTHHGRVGPSTMPTWTENPDSDIQEILEHFATDNRCFVIHVAAALGINPLQLENAIVKEAMYLLERPDLHPTKAKVLASIVEFDGSANANVLTLVYPEIMRHTIVRIVVLADNMDIQAAIAYKYANNTPAYTQVNLLKLV